MSSNPPPVTPTTVHVLCATDDAYAMPLGAALASATHELHPDARLAVTVLDGGLRAANRAKLRASVAPGRATLTFVDVTATPARRFAPKMHFNWVSLARLLAPEVLTVDRALWLDCDVIVCADLLDLWRTDLAGAALGAVRESTVGRRLPLAGELGLPPERPYFNAGVLVMDLAALRREDFTRRAFALLESHPGRLPMWDQDVLNLLAGHVPLDQAWNYIVLFCPPGLEAIGDARRRPHPHIVHYAAIPKPWHPEYSLTRPYADYFFRALERTPWAGWRPPIDLRTLVRANAPGFYGMLRQLKRRLGR